MRSHVLALFDLNGFKTYNDTFGHPAGDALLNRLAAKLAAAVEPDGSAYRMGGDEFCVLLPTREPDLHCIAQALWESGEGFDVTSAYGAAVIPDDAKTVSSPASSERCSVPSRAVGLPARISAAIHSARDRCASGVALRSLSARAAGGFVAQPAWRRADRHVTKHRPALFDLDAERDRG